MFQLYFIKNSKKLRKYNEICNKNSNIDKIILLLLYQLVITHLLHYNIGKQIGTYVVSI